MQMTGFFDFSVSPVVKVLICFSIVMAMVVVYWWKPDNKKRADIVELDRAMDYVEVDPTEHFAGKESLLSPESKRMSSSHNETLEHLDEYVKTLRRHHIGDMDDV